MYTINPPESDDLQVVLGVQAAIKLTFAMDMRELFEAKLTPIMGANWFLAIKRMRGARFDNVSIKDIAFYLREPYFNPDSPTWEFLPKDDDNFRRNLGRLIVDRNDWAHFDTFPNINNLSRSVVVFEDVALKLNLPHAINYTAIRDRCAAIMNGNYTQNSISPAGSFKDRILTNTELRDKRQEDLINEIGQSIDEGIEAMNRKQRPIIGSKWQGPWGNASYASSVRFQTCTIWRLIPR